MHPDDIGDALAQTITERSVIRDIRERGQYPTDLDGAPGDTADGRLMDRCNRPDV